jgi:N6-adenosine-specific RNA methylase IME4
MTTGLALYDAARRALAEAVAVDEVKNILDLAVAIRVLAKQAKDRDLEADAVELRMRATRRLAELIKAQKQTVGLAKGGKPYHRSGFTGLPQNLVATLAEAGIDKNLAHQARVLGALSDDKFKALVTDAHDKVARAVRNAVREVEILQEREAYAARTSQGGTVADLEALAASGYRAKVVYVDVPSEFEVYSGKGKQRAAERYYDTMTPDALKAMAPLVQALAADGCALLYWTTGPQMKHALDIVEAWGFTFKTLGFVWVKTNPSSGTRDLKDLSHDDLHWGMGYTTRANVEVVVLATRGAPMRLAADVHQVVIAPVGEHSEKPEEVARRIERLYPGPYLELFARRERDGWKTWGDELRPNGAPSRSRSRSISPRRSRG